MELIFETSGDNAGINQFTMEVGNSDTVIQIKQKIEQFKDFPISSQTLRFNGAILPDDFNLQGSQIVDHSTIHLHLRRRQHIDKNQDLQMELDKILRNPQTSRRSSAAAGNQPPTPIHQQSPIHPVAAGLHITQPAANSPSSSSSSIRVDIPRQIPNNRAIIRPVARRPGQAPPPPPTLTVLVRHGIQHARVVVRPEEAVSALRGKLQQIDQWRLPPRYEFIHNHCVMDEPRSFAVNQVLQGDVIRVSPRSP